MRVDRALERAGHPRDKIDIKYKLVHEYSSRVVPNGPGFLDEDQTSLGNRVATDLCRARKLEGFGQSVAKLVTLTLGSLHKGRSQGFQDCCPPHFLNQVETHKKSVLPTSIFEGTPSV